MVNWASQVAPLVKNLPAMQETPVQFLGQEDPLEKGWATHSSILGLPLYSWASLVAQLVKNPPAMWETWVGSLGWEDALEKGKATHSCILAWRIPWTVLDCISHGVTQSQTWLSDFHFTFIFMVNQRQCSDTAGAMTPEAVTFRPGTVLPWSQFLSRGQSCYLLLCPCNLSLNGLLLWVFSQNNSFCELFSGLPPCIWLSVPPLPCNLFPVLKLLLINAQVVSVSWLDSGKNKGGGEIPSFPDWPKLWGKASQCSTACFPKYLWRSVCCEASWASGTVKFRRRRYFWEPV